MTAQKGWGTSFVGKGRGVGDVRKTFVRKGTVEKRRMLEKPSWEGDVEKGMQEGDYG